MFGHWQIVLLTDFDSAIGRWWRDWHESAPLTNRPVSRSGVRFGALILELGLFPGSFLDS